jgi:hypothetical protein
MARPYKITDYDDSIQDIASRFGLETAFIIGMNQADLGGRDVNASFPMSLVGVVIQLPDDSLHFHYDWQSYVSPGGEGLSAVCTKALADPRFRSKGGWWLTPQSLLDAYENADVRGGHGKDPGAFTLAAGENVMVPYPARRAGAQTIPVTPNGATNVTLPPPWLTELTNRYESIRGDCRKFRALLSDLRRQQKVVLPELAILNALSGVLALALDHREHDLDYDSLRALQTELDNATKVADEEMYSKYFVNVASVAYDRMMAFGTVLIASIRDSNFVNLAKRLGAAAVRYPRAHNELSDVLAFAYQSLFDSPLRDEAEKDIEDLVKHLAGLHAVDTSKLPPADDKFIRAIKSISAAPVPNSALGAMCEVGQATAGSLGNLPGPSTVAVAAVRLYALYSGPRDAVNQLRLAASSPTALAIDEFRAACLAAAAINGLGHTQAERDDMLAEVAKIRGEVAKRFPYKTIRASIKESLKVSPALRDADARVASKTMSGKGVGAAFGLIDALVFGLAIVDLCTNGFTPDAGHNSDLANELAGGSISGLQAATFFGPLLDVLGESTAALIGDLCAVLSFGLSALQAGMALAQHRTGDAIVAGITMVGSAGLVVSLFIEASPLLILASGVLVVGATAYDAIRKLTFEDIEDLLRPAPEVWWLHVLDGFTKGPQYTAIAAKAPKLSTAMSSLRTTIRNTDFHMVPWRLRGEALKIIGAATIGMVAEPIPADIARVPDPAVPQPS